MELIWNCLVAYGAIAVSLRVLTALSRVGTTEQAQRPRSQSPEHRPAQGSENHLEC